MPAIHVRSTPIDRERAPAALTAIARAVAAAVPCEIDGVWCTFAALEAQTIGQRATEVEGRIVYVDVWMRQRDGDPPASERALEAACAAAAAGFGVPLEDVWGTLRPVEPGRVFAGGSLVE